MPQAIDPSTVALSPKAAAIALSVSRMTIYNLLAAGKLKARKLGNRTLISVESLQAYFASLPAYHPKLD